MRVPIRAHLERGGDDFLERVTAGEWKWNRAIARVDVVALGRPERARQIDVDAILQRIDLRAHEGAHPRIGAADVVPIVPLEPADMERARAVARVLGARIGALGLPVFLYDPPDRGPVGRLTGSERLALAHTLRFSIANGSEVT